MAADDLIADVPATAGKLRADGDHAEDARRVFSGLGISLLAERVWHWLPAALATLLVALTCAKAIMAVDVDWDSLAYHLPFAALRVGLLTPWQFQRPPNALLMGYYQGFPILGDLLQGWLWKLTGRPEAANLLGILSLSALVGYLKWTFRVPAAWAFIGLFAIPAVQTAIAGAYVDVPAGAAFTIVMFSLCELWADPDKFRRPARWIVMFLAAFAAANMKLQTAVFVCLTMPLVVPPTWQLLRRLGTTGWHWIGGGLLLLVSWLAIVYNLIKNLIVYDNPLWPIAISLGPVRLPGIASPDAFLTVFGQARPYQHYPQGLQWLMSILEFRALDGRTPPYSNGMGGVPETSLANSMGGFYGALVVASVAFFALGVWRDPSRRNLSFLLVFSYVTVFTAFFPNSQNLRYDIFWMMFLVAACMIILGSAELSAYQKSYKILLFSSLVFITSITGRTYFRPEWRPMQTYADVVRAEKILEKIVQPGDVICLQQGAGLENNLTIMFAPIFHQKLNAERPYGIREAGCDGYKTVSSW